MQAYIWHNAYVEVPSDWEMLRFAKDPREGQLAWADRYTYRMELHWRRMAEAPSMGRVVSDYIARMREQGHAGAIEKTQYEGWRGVHFQPQGEEPRATRFLRFVPELGCLLEVIFHWEGTEVDESLQERVLGSIRPERNPSAVSSFRWRAFGMDFDVGRPWMIRECQVLPAFARAVFRPRPEGREEILFERLGMVEDWLQDPLERWARARAPKYTRLDEVRQRFVSGHDVVELSGEVRPPIFARMVEPRRRYEAMAWRCPVDGRVYHASRAETAKSAAGMPPRATLLSCCDDFIHAL